MKNIEVYNTLNIDKDSSSIVATFTQEDDAVMEFKLFKDGQEIVLKDQTISLGAERKDGAVIEQEDGFLIKENNVLNITLKKNIISVVGVVKIQLYLKDTSGEMASNTFNIRVNKKLLGAENIEATNDIKTLNTLVLELKNNTNKLIDDTKAKADKLLNGLQETGDNLSSTVKAKTDKLIEDTKKDYDSLKKTIIDENISIKLQEDIKSLQNGLKSNQVLAYSGSSISAENTLEGRTERMKVKGRTLQNLIGVSKTITANVGETITKPIASLSLLQKGKKYTVIYNLTKASLLNTRCTPYIEGNGKTIYESNTENYNTTHGLKKWCFTNDSSFENGNLCFWVQGNNSIVEIKDFMILEDDWTDKEIPKYFEGIKSFGEAEQEGDKYKISILSSSRNLIDDSIKSNTEIDYNTGAERPNNQIVTTGFTPFFANTKRLYAQIIVNGVKFTPTFRWYDENKKYINANAITDIPINARYIRMRVLDSRRPINPNDCEFLLIDDTDKNLNYEPYQSNKKDILISAPLRGFDGIEDVMQENNGKVEIIRNIFIATLNGQEDIFVNNATPNQNNTIAFAIKNICKPASPLICDKFSYVTTPSFDSRDTESITTGGSDMYSLMIRINRNKLETQDVAGFRKWLQTNNIITYCVRNTPTTEIVESIDIDLDTFQDKTYFNILNSLPGVLDFKVPSNIGSSLQNLAKEVNNIWDVINNLLVPGILDTKKKIAMSTIKNNFK